MNEAEKVMSAIESVVKALVPLDSGERHRAIGASLVILGEKKTDISTKDDARNGEGDNAELEISTRARQWMKQNAVTASQLENIFDVANGQTAIIASEVPGKNNAEKTLKAYMLTGLARFIASGEVSFEDKAARELCENFGCYDSSNHFRYLQGKGNNFTGSKKGGWKMTAPGLRNGAVLVKEIAAI